MMFNMPEPNGNNIKSKISEDIASAKNILANIIEPNKIKKVIRVGRIGANPRPVKIIFESNDDVLHILKNVRAIDTHGIKVTSDLTPHQKTYLDNLRKDLESRKANGENKTIKYIRGTPQIVDQKN